MPAKLAGGQAQGGPGRLRGRGGAHLAPLGLLDHVAARAGPGRARGAPATSRWPTATPCRPRVAEDIGDAELGGLIVQRGATHHPLLDRPRGRGPGRDRLLAGGGGREAPRPGAGVLRQAPRPLRGQVHRRLAGLLDRRRVRVGAQGRQGREADPDRLPDRRARHRAVRADAGRGGRARRGLDPRVRPGHAVRGPGAARRRLRAVRPRRARAPRWPTSRTGARPRSTTSRPSGSRWAATRSCPGCRSTWAAG